MTALGSRAPSQLDLWIAGTMHASQDAMRRLAHAGLSKADAQRAVAQLNASGLSDSRNLDSSALRRLFGQPVRIANDSFLYNLVLWPGHWYRWCVADGGSSATDGGFVRRSGTKLVAPVHLRMGDLRAVLQVWEHTDEDVVRALGRPHQEQAWWPQISLHYRMADGAAAVLTFDHGLLCGVETSMQ